MRTEKFIPRLVLLVLVTLGSVGLPVTPGHAQGEDPPLFFEETGHAVSDEFLDYFKSKGGLALFGYPITEPFSENGLRVQYFQNARMEYHRYNPDPYKIQLGLLGDQLNYRQPAITAPRFASRRRVYFPETGHIVSYAFLDFFREHGGIDIFGYPISEMYFENGRIVQYFQRMKLEWHPEDRDNPVKIGNLGEIYVNAYRNRIPLDALRPRGSPIIDPEAAPITPQAPSITEIDAVVSLRYSVMGRQDSQTVSVLVTDNNDDPVDRARVVIHFIDATGEIFTSTSTLTTDRRGFVQISVPVTQGNTGEQVIVRADVQLGNLQTSGESVFLIWW